MTSSLRSPTPTSLSQSSVDQFVGSIQPTKVSAKAETLSLTLNGTEIVFAHGIGLNCAPSIPTLTGRPTEDPEAILGDDNPILMMSTARVYESQGGSDPLDPELHLEEVPSIGALPTCPARERAAPTLTVMLESMPATQAYAVATSYMNSWETECIPTLPAVFLALQYLPGQCHMLEVAMKALAAYQLSRGSFRNRQPTTHKLALSRTTPDLQHETFAHQFYGVAIRAIRQWVPSTSEPSSTALAVMILFCCLESVMGNFEAFSLHSLGIQRLLDADVQLLSETDDPRSQLLAAWTQAKIHNWWLRFHFSTPAMHFQDTTLSLPRGASADSRRYTRLVILYTLYNLYRTQFASLAHLWYQIQTSSCSLSSNISWYPAGSNMLDKSLHLLDHAGSESRKAARRSLDECYARILPAERPIDSTCDRGNDKSIISGPLQIKPIRFATHQAAMNYAYYSAAQVMTCSGILGLSSGVHHDKGNYTTDEEDWTLKLLQIAAGLDWSDCLRFNIHTIGIVSLLFACVLRTTNPAIGSWVEDWMSRRGVSEVTEEGSFPNLQVLQALRLVNAERCGGRDVLALYLPVDDGGGVGKHGSYTSQTISSLIVFGRCRGTGMLYSRCSEV